jgi:hypothetical protein
LKFGLSGLTTGCNGRGSRAAAEPQPYGVYLLSLVTHHQDESLSYSDHIDNLISVSDNLSFWQIISPSDNTRVVSHAWGWYVCVASASTLAHQQRALLAGAVPGRHTRKEYALKGWLLQKYDKEFFPNEIHAIMRQREGFGSKNNNFGDFLLARGPQKLGLWWPSPPHNLG